MLTGPMSGPDWQSGLIERLWLGRGTQGNDHKTTRNSFRPRKEHLGDSDTAMERDERPTLADARAQGPAPDEDMS